MEFILNSKFYLNKNNNNNNNKLKKNIGASFKLGIIHGITSLYLDIYFEV